MLPPLVIKIFGDNQFSQSANQLTKNIGSMGKKINRVGKGLTAGLSIPMGLAGIASLKMANDFNASMANVGTLIPGQTKRLEELKKEVQALAIETGKSTGDIAQGLFQTISAFGDDGVDTMVKLRANTRGAVAGVSTVGDAINLTSLVTKAYGDTTAETTQKVLNLAFKANELGQTTFPEMAASLGKAVPFSKTLGVSMEELFGVMGTFTGVTGNTAEVTTQLTSFLGALLKPTGDMDKAFRLLGVQSGEELIRQKGLKGSMEALFKATKPYPGILAKVLGRKEALNIVLSATGAQADTFAKKTEKMSNVVGAAELAFKQQSDGINKNGFALKKLGVKLSVTAQKLGDVIATAIIPAIDFFGKLLDKFNMLSPSTKKVIVVLGALAVVIPPLIALVGTLAVAVNAVGWPFALIAIAIGAVIALVTILVIKWKEIMAWFRKMPVVVSILLGPFFTLMKVIQLLTDKWDALLDTFKSSWTWIKKLGRLIPATFTGNSKAFDDFSQASEKAGKAWRGLASPIATGDQVHRGGLGPSRGTSLIEGMGPLRSLQNEAKVKLDFSNLPSGVTVKTEDKNNILELDRGLMTAGN